MDHVIMDMNTGEFYSKAGCIDDWTSDEQDACCYTDDEIGLELRLLRSQESGRNLVSMPANEELDG